MPKVEQIDPQTERHCAKLRAELAKRGVPLGKGSLYAGCERTPWGWERKAAEERKQ